MIDGKPLGIIITFQTCRVRIAKTTLRGNKTEIRYSHARSNRNDRMTEWQNLCKEAKNLHLSAWGILKYNEVTGMMGKVRWVYCDVVLPPYAWINYTAGKRNLIKFDFEEYYENSSKYLRFLFRCDNSNVYFTQEHAYFFRSRIKYLRKRKLHKSFSLLG